MLAENLTKNTRESLEFNPLEMTGDSLTRNIEQAVHKANNLDTPVFDEKQKRKDNKAMIDELKDVINNYSDNESFTQMSKQSRARRSSPNRLLYQPGLSPKYTEPKLQTGSRC